MKKWQMKFTQSQSASLSYFVLNWKLLGTKKQMPDFTRIKHFNRRPERWLTGLNSTTAPLQWLPLNKINMTNTVHIIQKLDAVFDSLQWHKDSSALFLDSSETNLQR